MPKRKRALVVVACVAGFGAWGQATQGISVSVANDATYAAELFGEGADALTITYPSSTGTSENPASEQNPTVTITWIAAHKAPTSDNADNTAELNPDLAANSEVEITWTLGNATFGQVVQASDFAKGGFDSLSVSEGGAKGDKSVTTTLTAGSSETNTGALFPATGETKVVFTVPRLTGISALSNPTKKVSVTASLRVTKGSTTSKTTTGATKNFTVAFPTGKLDSSVNIVHSASVVTLSESKAMRTGDDSTRIDIDKRTMLRANAASGAYTDAAAVKAYRPKTYGVTGQAWSAQLAYLTVDVMSQMAACSSPAKDTDAPNCGDVIHQWDGTRVDSDVAGVLDIDVSGAIRDGDMVFANQMDANSWASPWTPGDKRSIDSGESLTVTEGMAEFTSGGFSIDPGNTDEDAPSASHTFGVYYIPNGKDDLAHGAMIRLTALVNYTRPSSLDERPVTTTTELRFHGVNDAVKAYAIPFSGNGQGDKGNVRIRCEAGDLFSGGKQCRPFLECWDDMGMRGFGEADAIGTNALMRLDSMMVEEVIGMEEAESRHSCRVLSTGTTSVQQLTRDGTTGTLVNNTYVGE